jgi:hypothetical protein
MRTKRTRPAPKTFPRTSRGAPRSGGTGVDHTVASVPPGLPPGFEGLEYVLQCTYGHYPWDDWEKTALAAGVPKELAGLGRLTMREAFQHGWPECLKSFCGWRDQGQAMIKLALRSPRKARRQWDILMRTDGLRGDYRPRSTEWAWGYLRPGACRLISALTLQWKELR